MPTPIHVAVSPARACSTESDTACPAFSLLPLWRVAGASLLAFFLTLPLHLHAAPESAYVEHWCEANNGVADYTLPDRTRVDCLTRTYAVEAEFTRKWAQAPGQAYHYAAMTNRLPGVLLIVEDREAEWRYVPRLIHAIRAPVRVWIIHPEDLPEP